jgi:hypothetical protein
MAGLPYPTSGAPNGPIVHLHASPPQLTRRGAAVAATNDAFGGSELQLT